MQAGERVLVAGAPRGGVSALTEGVYNGPAEVDHKGTLTQFTAPISPGSTGAAVLDDRAEVIAVATLSVDKNLNFGASVEDIKRLLDGDNRVLSVSDLVARVGHDCGRGGIFQCATNCWIDDGQSCHVLGKEAEQASRAKEALEHYEHACRLNDFDGCDDWAMLEYKELPKDRQAMRKAFDVASFACSRGGGAACRSVVAIAPAAGKDLSPADTRRLLDRACKDQNKHACEELATKPGAKPAKASAKPRIVATK
jgi:hypothetical protein